MARTALSILLLSLALLISTVYGINGTQCDILSNPTNSSSAFSLTVSPETLSANTSYTVTVHGSGNATVILQASASSSPAGNWSSVNISCNEGPLFLNAFENGNLQANWKSPTSLTSVNITAHVQNENGTFVVSITLNQAASTPTTVAPSNSTSATNSTTTTTKATTIAKTTSGGCSVQAGLLTVALIHILGFLTGHYSS